MTDNRIVSEPRRPIVLGVSWSNAQTTDSLLTPPIWHVLIHQLLWTIQRSFWVATCWSILASHDRVHQQCADPQMVSSWQVWFWILLSTTRSIYIVSQFRFKKASFLASWLHQMQRRFSLHLLFWQEIEKRCQAGIRIVMNAIFSGFSEFS